MKVEKIDPPEPVEVPVATLTVTQKELDLLTALVNECGQTHDEIGYHLYTELSAAGGDVHAWELNLTNSPTAWSVIFQPKYKQ